MEPQVIDPIATSAPTEHRRVFVVLNPHSGRAQPDPLQEMIEQTFRDAETPFTIHTIVEGDDIPALVRAAVADGYTDVVAVGGDGTVSAVAGGLLHSRARLAILPAGTANVLARELQIPLDLAEATALIVLPHKEIMLDAMGLPDRIALLQIAIGLGSVMIRDTQPWAKRLIGRAAYLSTAFIRMFGFEPRRFQITVDNQRTSIAAMQVVVANGGVMGMPPFRWGPDISPSDGQIDVAVLRARSVRTLLHLGWLLLRGKHHRSPNIRYFHAHQRLHINAEPPLPVEADGEIIGETPCTIEVIAAAVCVIVPPDLDLDAATP